MSYIHATDKKIHNNEEKLGLNLSQDDWLHVNGFVFDVRKARSIQWFRNKNFDFIFENRIPLWTNKKVLTKWSVNEE